MIETKQELKYVMDFYGLKKIPVINDNKRLGIINSNLCYERSEYWSYKSGYEHLAFADAIRKVNEDMENIKTWREKSKKIYETRLVYCGKTKSIENGYCWTSDIKDSGVGVKKDADGYLVFFGNINSLRKFLSYAKNHWRYCYNSDYKYENAELCELMQLFSDYGIYAPYDSFSEYYHNSIVD